MFSHRRTAGAGRFRPEYQRDHSVTAMVSSQEDHSVADDVTKDAVSKTSYHGIDKIDSGVGQAGIIHDVARVIDHQAERSLCRKFDIRLLPIIATMYLFNALDKGNLSNAQTDGLSDGKHQRHTALLITILWF